MSAPEELVQEYVRVARHARVNEDDATREEYAREVLRRHGSSALRSEVAWCYDSKGRPSPVELMRGVAWRRQ